MHKVVISDFAAMGKRAFSGGMTDYCWIVWDVKRPTKPGQTRTIWLPRCTAIPKSCHLRRQ